MPDEEMARAEARPPRAAEILSLLVIVTMVAASVRAVAASALLPPWPSAMLVGAVAALIGVPILAFALEHGFTGLLAALGFGVLAGALPPLSLLASGAIGLAARGGPSYLRWVFTHGVSIPYWGLLTWPQFLLLAGRSSVVGVASAAIYWLTHLDSPEGSAWVAWWLAALVLATAVIVSWQLG